ncbi:MAG: enoyl-CoA hydratase/isomerase family protein [Dehalococcoidia bacterium]|nr:enoyl-CoA hydratase/isomerase family protein [Dehalococcoidia bacterium]
MDFETVILKKEGHIATITMNRPEMMNALNTQMLQEMVAAIDEIACNDDVRVVVLTGAGRIFCSGADISEGGKASGLSGTPVEMHHNLRNSYQKVALRLQRLDKPTIAMVNGAAVGAGCDFAFACDMRVGSEKARFRNGFVRVGLIPGGGGTWLYTRLMGLGRGLEFLFTGDFLEAEEAEHIGVLNKIVPADDLERETMELAQKIANNPPLAVQMSKMMAYKALDSDLEAALEQAAACQALALSSEDHREGVNAFIEKREAQFKGR